MQRPEHQWYISHEERAKRVPISSPEEGLRWVESQGLPSQLGTRLREVVAADPQRVELFHFEFVDVQSEMGRAPQPTTDLGGWALFTPRIQLIHKDTSTLSEERQCIFTRALFLAAASWLIARGSDTIEIWFNGTRLSLTDFGGVQRREPLLSRLNRVLAEVSPPPPKVVRLITLAPSNLEIVEALEALDRLIACEDSSDLPASHADKMPRLGPDLNPDLDEVMRHSPDLVLSSLSVPGMERIVTGLATRQISQVVLAPRTIQDVLGDIDQVAGLLQIADRGDRVSQRMRDERDELARQRPVQPARVYLEWWPKPMFTPGAQCFSNELIELAGGVNVFKNRSGSSVEITPQELVEAEPDICFISWCGAPYAKLNPDNLRSRQGLEQLNERARAHVTPIDEAYTGRPGPRMLEASRQMARVIQQLTKSTINDP